MLLDGITLHIISIVVIALCTFQYFRRTKAPYPPGPRGLPVLGVISEHPKTEYWKTYAHWGKKYGPMGVISFHVLGRRIVVLNTARAVADMFEKNSLIYSDRPFPTMAGLLMRREKSIFFMKYGERFRNYRKLMQQDFNYAASKKYWDVQEAEARLLVSNLLRMTDSQQLDALLKRNAAAVILRVAYGYSVKSPDDYFVTLSEECMHVASLAMKPGKWLVDSFPLLRFIPSWFPGIKFHKLAKEWSEQLCTKSLKPHNYVKDQMARGIAKPSFTSLHLQPPVSAEHEDIVFWTAGSLYAGATDSTVAVVKVFFLLMCRFPDIQKRAQAEIDSVIGTDRLPNLEDRDQLPFLNNVISEVLRWAPPGPLIPHSPSQNDIFDGYYIPKGCTVFANMWAILRDESVYDNPHEFNPDRYDASNINPEPDPRRWVFGFGRRVCPGNHIGDSTVFIQVATVLATVDILPAIDLHGKEIEPEAIFTTGIVSSIESFPFRVKPRSVAASLLIDSAVNALDQ